MKSEYQKIVTDILLDWLDANYYPERHKNITIDMHHRTSRGMCRPDIAIDEWFNERMDTKPITTIIEIKSSYSDLKSGYGLNLYGDYNFICFHESLLCEDTIDKYMDQHTPFSDRYGLIKVLSDGQIIAERPAPANIKNFGFLFARNIGEWKRQEK